MLDYSFRKWGEAQAPCKECKDRTSNPNCHGINEDGSYRCERYEAFKSANDKERDIRRQMLHDNDILSDIHKRRRKK